MCPTPYSSDRQTCEGGKGDVSDYETQTNPTGWYSYGMQVNCYPAPPGMSIASTADRPTWCTREEYSQTGDADCTICPADHECEEHNLEPKACAVDGSELY